MHPLLSPSVLGTTLLLSLPLAQAAAVSVQDPDHGDGGPPPFEAPALCPEPLQVEPRWAPLTLTAEGRVVFAEPHLEALAHVLARDLAAQTGLTLAVAAAPGRSGDVILSEGYLPPELSNNPEAFFVEVLDHVLVSGQSADGAARACARLLQLVRPVLTDGAPTGIDLPAVRIVDAPSMHWRVLGVQIEPLLEALAPDATDTARAAARSIVREAHLAGFNALQLLDGARGVAGRDEVAAVAKLLLAECEARRVTLVAPGELELGSGALRWSAAPPTAAALQAAVEGDFHWLAPAAPDSRPLALSELAPDTTDEARALRLLERCLHPIAPPIVNADGRALLGQLYGHRTSLADEVYLPVAWRAGAPTAVVAWAPLAAEAWHAGRREDRLQGRAALERVLAGAAR